MSAAIDPSPAAVTPFPVTWTLADLQQHLGGIPVRRIRLYPTPGTATEEDALWLDDHEDRICELVEGVLVEKVMSSYESYLAMILGHFINTYLEADNRGIILGEAGQLRILPTKMRVPDVAFINWDRFPGGKLPKQRVYRVAPDLAVEILSEGNTQEEMAIKLVEYFEAGAKLVWYIDPAKRSATIYTSTENVVTIDENGLLEGKDVLPGFQLRLGDLLDRATRRK